MEFSELNENAIQQIKAQEPTFLEKARRSGYICPACGNGSGATGDGICLDKKSGRWHCFKCGLHADIIDLYAKANNISGSYPQQVKAAAKYYNINIENAKENFYTSNTNITVNTKPSVDFYIECINNWQDNPQGVEYLNSRGISTDTAIKCNVGFCHNWKHPKTQNAPASDRVIFPNTANSYSTRAISANVSEEYQKQKVGEQEKLFNESALYNDSGVVVVCEGEFDTLSIVEITGKNNAVGLGSVSNCKKLISALQEKPTDNVIIIALDNDPAGRGATQVLEKGLKKLNVSFLKANLCGSYKDENEYLTNDRAGFTRSVRRTIENSLQFVVDDVRNYLDNCFNGAIEEFKKYCGRKTGLDNLDQKSGGLFPGLYVCVAGTSMGKTTFALQIADNLAANGEDVLYFCMEQGTFELVSKSLARITAQIDKKHAFTSLEIRCGSHGGTLEQAKARYYNTIAKHMHIIEGNFDCTVNKMCDCIEKFIDKNKRVPVVFVDYLQLIQSEDEQQAKRLAMDHAVSGLRQLCRDTNCTVFLISAIGRNEYTQTVSEGSAKESGGIEYTADVLYGLQFACIDTEKEFNSSEKVKMKEKRDILEAAAKAYPRKITLKCVKNRYGPKNWRTSFDYYPDVDLFSPLFDNMQDLKASMSNTVQKGF